RRAGAVAAVRARPVGRAELLLPHAGDRAAALLRAGQSRRSGGARVARQLQGARDGAGDAGVGRLSRAGSPCPPLGPWSSRSTLHWIDQLRETAPARAGQVLATLPRPRPGPTAATLATAGRRPSAGACPRPRSPARCRRARRSSSSRGRPRRGG